MQEFGKHVPDITTFAANLVVFLAAIGAAVAGSLAMVKKVKKEWEEAFPKNPTPIAPGNGDVVTQQRMIGTLMMETTTAAMLSASQERLADTMDEVKDELRDNRSAVCSLRDEMRELRHELQFHRNR